jgi:hypothetical protein
VSHGAGDLWRLAICAQLRPTWHSCISSLLKSSIAAGPALQARPAVKTLAGRRSSGPATGTLQWGASSTSQAGGEDAGDWRLGVLRLIFSVDSDSLTAC